VVVCACAFYRRGIYPKLVDSKERNGKRLASWHLRDNF